MRNVVIVIVSVLLIAAVGSSGWLYYQKEELSQEYKKAQKEWFRKEQKLSERLKETKENVKEFKKKLSKIKGELKDTHNKLEAIKEQKKNLKYQIEAQGSQLEKLKDQLNEKKQKISKLEEKNKNYKKRFKELEEDYKNLYSDTVEDYDVPSSKFSKRLSQWVNQKDKLKDKLQSLSEKLQTSGVEREELIDEINKVNSLLKRRIVEIASFKKKLDKLKEKSKELAMEKAFSSVSSVQLPSIIINKKGENEELLFSDIKEDISFISEKSGTEDKKKEEGKILAVNQAENFVILNVGSNDGIEKGMVFEVFRNGNRIGKVKVIEVRGELSAANIEKVIYGRIITANDRVKLYE